MPIPAPVRRLKYKNRVLNFIALEKFLPQLRLKHNKQEFNLPYGVTVKLF